MVWSSARPAAIIVEVPPPRNGVPASDKFAEDVRLHRTGLETMQSQRQPAPPSESTPAESQMTFTDRAPSQTWERLDLADAAELGLGLVQAGERTAGARFCEFPTRYTAANRMSLPN